MSVDLTKLDTKDPLTRLYDIAMFIADAGIKDEKRRKVYETYIEAQFEAAYEKQISNA